MRFWESGYGVFMIWSIWGGVAGCNIENSQDMDITSSAHFYISEFFCSFMVIM
jgi:hypothetical protein